MPIEYKHASINDPNLPVFVKDFLQIMEWAVNRDDNLEACATAWVSSVLSFWMLGLNRDADHVKEFIQELIDEHIAPVQAAQRASMEGKIK